MNKNKLIELRNSGIILINSGEMFSDIPDQFEPIRKDLFSLEFPAEMGIDNRFEVKAARPSVTNASKEVQFKHMSFYYKGKTKVGGEISIDFRDTIGVSIYQKLEAWQRQHTDMATGMGGYASTYKKTLTLNMEDPAGGVIQKFYLYGCFITGLDGGDVDMGSDDIANVSMKIQYDRYSLEF